MRDLRSRRRRVGHGRSSHGKVKSMTVIVCRLGDMLKEAVTLQQLHQTWSVLVDVNVDVATDTGTSNTANRQIIEENRRQRQTARTIYAESCSSP